MDDQIISLWYSSLPPAFRTEDPQIPEGYEMSYALILWKYRNFKIIMYRYFVVRQSMYSQEGCQDDSPETVQAYSRCLDEARLTILSIEEFWQRHEHTRAGAWYAL